MACSDIIQPHSDWLQTSPPKDFKHLVRFDLGGLDAGGVGNYAEGEFTALENSPSLMAGTAFLFFSDRKNNGQPFDIQQVDGVRATLGVPNGLLEFHDYLTRALITRFVLWNAAVTA